MKIAIVYATVGGTTKECASLLAKELKNQEVELFEIGKNEPVISDFDVRQTMIRKIVMQNAKQNIFLFEKEKRGKKLLYTLCRTEDVTAVLMTDEAEKN